MAKYSSVLTGEPERQPRRSRGPFWFLLIVILVTLPPLYEAGLLVYAQWQPIIGGRIFEPRTPLLDGVQEAFRMACDETRYQVAPMLHTGAWQPTMVVPIIITVAAIGVIFLRKGH
jgi:hypothetical protein